MKNYTLIFNRINILFIFILLIKASLVSGQVPCIMNITNGTLGQDNVYMKIENCTINISQKVQLRGQIDFKNCIFNMDRNSEINLQKPKKVGRYISYKNNVTFEGCNLRASNGTWAGINVASGSILITIGSNQIREASIGINVAYGSYCSLQGINFDGCGIGVNFPNLDSRFDAGIRSAINLTEFSGNTFNRCNTGLKIKDIDSRITVNIGKNSSSTNSINSSYATGVMVENSNVEISNCKFLYNNLDVDVVNNINSQRKCTITGLGETMITFKDWYKSSIHVKGSWQIIDIEKAKFYNSWSTKTIDVEELNNGDFIIANNIFENYYTELASDDQSFIIGIRNSSELRRPSINFNKFLEPGGGTFSIKLKNLKPTYYIDVSDNVLYGYDIIDKKTNQKVGEYPSEKVWCAFHSENCDDVTFNSNKLSFLHNGAVNDHGLFVTWEMHHMNGKRNKFTNNTVTNKETINREAIRLEGNVEDDILCGNSVVNSKKGILIVDNSPGIRITSNNIYGDGPNNNQNGLEINGNIPSQIHEGNKWYGNSFEFEAFLNPSLGIDIIRKANAFYSRDDNYNLNFKYWPTLVNRNDWFLDDKTVKHPNTCIKSIPPPCINSSDYLSDNIFRDGLSQGERWDNDSYFLKYYRYNPNCLTTSGQVNLYNVLANGDFQNYQLLEERINKFYSIDNNTRENINYKKSLFDSLCREYALLYSTFDPNDTIILDSLIYLNNLNENIAGVRSELDSILGEIDSLRLIEINNLCSLCNSLIISNEYDSLYKSYYEVLIKKLKNEDLSNEDHDFLVYLSRLCPKIYGSLAYKGNALLEGIHHLESLSNNCAPQQMALQNSNTDNTYNNCEIKLYPNPINGSQELFIKSTCQFENGYLIDLFGNHITLYPGLQSTDETNLLISKANIISGIYFLKINFKNGNVFMKKIIIN